FRNVFPLHGYDTGGKASASKQLSEDPEGQVHAGEREDAGAGATSSHENGAHESQRPSSEDPHTLKDGGDRESREYPQAIRRSRSGRPLRSTVQYDERSSRGSSPDNHSASESQEQPLYGRRTRSSYHPHQGDFVEGEDRDLNHPERSEQESGREHENDMHGNMDGRHQGNSRYGDGNQDELVSDDDRAGDDDDGFGEEDGDDGNNEGSETNSSKNDDGSEPLNISMYGSPSLVKVRSMFIDKLYKMVEDPAIQHLISWAKDGDMFYVYNCIELSSSVLPKFFKHNNWQSFVRQLNKESTMNRRNPETQRWQFYHPDFQRDRPHLRNNIKRKSARSGNIAPTFSRVVFERDKGYYVQQESPSSRAPSFNNNVQGGGHHSRTHNSNNPQGQRVLGHMHGGPGGLATGPHHYSTHPSSTVHRSPHDPAHRLSVTKQLSEHGRAAPAGHPASDGMHSREDKDIVMSSRHHLPPAHHQQPRRDHEPQPHPHHQYYAGASPYRHQQPPPQQGYGSPHQRQHSYAGPPSQAHYSPEQGYSHESQVFTSPQPAPQELLHPAQPPTSAVGVGRSTYPGHGPSGGSGAGAGRDSGGYTDHGTMLTGGHFRSQSAPGLDPRRGGDSARGPHPFSQQDSTQPPHSPPPSQHPNSQSYYQREPYPSTHGHQQPLPPPPPPPHGRHHGSFHEDTAVKAQPGSDSGSLTVGDGFSPSSNRGSLSKHPSSPKGHAQPHAGATPTANAPPTRAPYQYVDQQPLHRHDHTPVHRKSSGDQDDLHRRYSPPGQSSPSQQQHPHHGPVDPAHIGESMPTAPRMDTQGVTSVGSVDNTHPSPHDPIPRAAVKHLEDRLAFVEDSYMSLRRFAQELQNIQASQDQTIAWMRDRIDYLTEASTPRDVIMSPPLGQAGVVPSKRKAEPGSGDLRDWSRRGPPLSDQQHAQGYPRQGGVGGAPASGSSPSLPPSGGALSSSGGGSGAPGDRTGSRYEAPGYHSSFNPVHHSSQVLASGPGPRLSPPSHHGQHRSPPINASGNAHYQKAPITGMLHD
ncbi:hypothetical protein BGZ98_007219, partial [Dissophora globulifera]